VIVNPNGCGVSLGNPINKEAVLINTPLKIDTKSIFTATLYCHTFHKWIKAEIF